MYITTNRMLPRGTRVRLELCAERGPSAMVEAVVARTQRSSHQIRPNGLGVRFLSCEEVLSEVLPGLDPRHLPEDTGDLPLGAFPLEYTTRRQFRQIYERDLATGGLFVPSRLPAELNSVITVQLRVADSPPLLLKARVVHILEPRSGSPVSGMGVEVLELDQHRAALETLLNGC